MADKRDTYDDNGSGFSKEFVIWITLLVSIILILCVFDLCGPLSGIFGAFLFGMFGFMAYIFPFLLFFSAGFYLMNKNNRRVTGRIIASWILYIIIASLFQLFKTEQAESIIKCYTQGYTEKMGGGLIGGLISTGLTSAVGTFAAALILIIISIMLLVYITGKLIASRVLDKSTEKYNEYKKQRRSEQGEDRVDLVAAPKRRERTKRYTYTFPKEDNVNAAPETPKKSRKGKTKDMPKEDAKEIVNRTPEKKQPASFEEQTVTVHRGDEQQTLPIYQREIDEKFGTTASSKTDDSLDRLIARATSPDEDIINETETSLGNNIDNIIDEINNETPSVMPSDNPVTPSNSPAVSTDNPGMGSAVSNIKDTQDSQPQSMQTQVSDGEDIYIKLPPEPIKYTFPSLDLLTKPKRSKKGMTDRELKETAIKLKECLKSFKVDVTITDIICGPTVTRYELMPALGTRVKKITELENDIKLNLAVADIRIEAPIPGKSAVGIEVPNSDDSLITLREILESDEFISHKSNIAFAAGKDIGGRNIVADIAKMPHLLIAGATGSGKSVCINTIVMSLIYKADPNDVKLIMIDPKVVELSVYNGIPYLCIPVVTDPKKAAAALNWAVAEMNERYSKFAELGVRDMSGFNKKIEKLKDNPNMYTKMPQIVIIVDELADLMRGASHDVETAICRLAQMARAAGIHLIIATQRPSVDVITGLIKANIPSRIAFAVSSSIDSRTILDSSGAEKLLGKGDMLFSPQDISKPIRVQGAFVSDSEVARVTDFIKAQYDAPVYDETIKDQIDNTEISTKSSDKSADQSADDNNGRDELFAEAGRFIIEKQKASIGTLQRVFKIGFNRGARIMDQLCEAGVVSEEDGKKPRNILMTLEEFEQIVSEGR